MVFRGVGVGGFAEYVVMPVDRRGEDPTDVPLDVACVIGCAVQTGVGAVLNTARVEEGATVLVMGLGGDRPQHRAGRAPRGRGAHHRRRSGARRGARRRSGSARPTCIDPGAADVASRAFELTGIGVDYAFDAVGRASLVQTGVAATRNGGTTVCVGAAPIEDAVVRSRRRRCSR